MANLIDNVKEVDRLAEIHSQITKGGPGRKHKVEVLHKSSIVLLVACWEAFIEDLAQAALEHMILAGKNHDVFPATLLERVASSYSGPKVWHLAGDGWRKALRDNLKSVLAKTTGTLNTPKTAQIDELFLKTIGLEHLSDSWQWKGRSSAQSKDTLDGIVTRRGSIAHRVSAAKNVRLNDVKSSREFIFRLCVRSHNRASQFLVAQVGTSPWQKYWFGETS